MNPATTRITIIIPTHNRSISTKRMLDKLAQQTYPMELMEVVVVANDCKDDTVAMLTEHKAPYAFQFAETNGSGPAVPRNKGASMAKGTVLIFLDDDVDPSEGLAEAHVRTHENENTVVIGYLPLAMPEKPDYFRKNLFAWWEHKFQQMRRRGHRFRYEDLLSGNFSISSNLYRKVNGFITDLRCRDDYELGIRLLQTDAIFKFSMEARGIHLDHVTDFNRSLSRKREEGRTDVRLWKIHPTITNEIQGEPANDKYLFLQSGKLQLMIYTPWLTDTVARLSKSVLKLIQRIGLRGLWLRVSYSLLRYWYYRGLLDELKTREALEIFFSLPPIPEEMVVHDIDLVNGLKSAETLLDNEPAHAARIWIGAKMIGIIPHQHGTERLRGRHLRRILATEFNAEISEGLALKELATKLESRGSRQHGR